MRRTLRGTRDAFCTFGMGRSVPMSRCRRISRSLRAPFTKLPWSPLERGTKDEGRKTAMDLTESLRVALRALGANKLRSALTMLGMIIGVGAVIALMSIGKGVQASVTAQIQGLGTNLLFITPGAQQQGGVRTQAGTAPTLTAEDAQAILDSVPQVAAVAPEAPTGGQVIANGQNVFTRIDGVTPDFQDVRNFHVAEGDFITQQHLDARSLVAVLGANVAQTLFGDSDPIGQTIRINQINLRIIGVMESKGAQAQGNQDDIVFVPLTTAQTRLN